MSKLKRTAGNRINLFALLALLTPSMMLTSPKAGKAQTIPAAQSLIYHQDFSSLPYNSTAYPTGWQGWQIATTVGSTFKTVQPLADLPLTATSTAATTTAPIMNYDGKIGFRAQAGYDPSLTFALNTAGYSDIQVTFDVMTIRNQQNGSSQTRQGNVELQYCIGNSLGGFTSIGGSIYHNNNVNQTGAVTTPQNTQTVTLQLPSICNEQSVVQLRWVCRDSSGVGNRPSFAFDNICVTGNTTIQTNGSTTLCPGSNVRLTAPLAISYLWSTGETSKTISPASSGIYSVTSTAAPGCAVTCSLAVTAVDPVIFSESMGLVSTSTSIASHETAGGFDNDALTMSGTANLLLCLSA